MSGPIRAYWERNGGLPIFGFPIGPQQEELVEGQPRQVQWFERTRLELHPENQRPYDVLLGRLGVDRLVQQGRPDWHTFPTDPPTGDCLRFETGHSVCGLFLATWRASGLEFDGRPGASFAESMALFGLPVSSPALEVLDGQVRTVQWFERARFELHPEQAPPFRVLLGLLGNEIRQTAQATPSSAGSEADALTAVGERIAFSARDADHGQELWVSDGTTPGTRLVKDLLPGAEGSWPGNLVDVNDTLLFTARTVADGSDSLWRSDGTSEGTVELLPATQLRDPTQLTVVGDLTFFIADDGIHGAELWVTDGTTQGTRLVKDVYPGARGIQPEQNMPMGYLYYGLTRVGRLVYFTAEAPGLGYGLWTSDGTTAGTSFVARLGTEELSAEYWELTALHDGLLFVARTGRLNYGLYRSDGTAEGTQLLFDFSYEHDPGSIRLYPPVSGPQAIGDQVYFTASGVLWTTDGTPEGTIQISQLRTGDVAGIGRQAYFLSLSRPYGFDLVQAGQVGGESMVATVAPTLYQPGGALAGAGGRLFIAVNGVGGRAELWVSDGTAQGTRPLMAVLGRLFGRTDGGAGARQTVALGDRLVFIVDDGVHGSEPWVSDGTPAGTVLLKDINTSGAATPASAGADGPAVRVRSK